MSSVLLASVGIASEAITSTDSKGKESCQTPRHQTPQTLQSQARSIIGKPHPSLTFKTLSGEEKNLSDLLGKSIMIVFSNVDTNKEFKDWKAVEKFARGLDPETAQMIFVNIAAPSDLHSSIEDQLPIDPSVIGGHANYGPDSKVSQDWGVFKTPMFYLVSPTGKVVYNPEVWADFFKAKQWFNSIRSNDLNGKRAPDFPYLTLAGSTKRLSELKGRPVLLVFIVDMHLIAFEDQGIGPQLSLAAKRASELRGAMVLIISANSSDIQKGRIALDKRLEESSIEGFTFNTEKDLKSIFDQYAQTGSPKYILVDSDGNIDLHFAKMPIVLDRSKRFLSVVEAAFQK